MHRLTRNNFTHRRWSRRITGRFIALFLVFTIILSLGGNAAIQARAENTTIPSTTITTEETTPADKTTPKEETAPADPPADETEEVEESVEDTKPTEEESAEEESEDTSPQEAVTYGTTPTYGNVNYDATGNVYSSDVRIDFILNPSDVKADDYTYTYTYPDGVIIPDTLLNTDRNLNDANTGNSAGTYRYIKNDDGTYSVKVSFDHTYVDNIKTYIPGNISYEGRISADKGNTDGSITLKGSDGTEITIPASQITYPGGETNAYDITATKGGSYTAKDGTITYRVIVSSYKGTPDTISYEDAIKATGMDLGTPTVTIKRQGINRYTNGSGWYDDTSNPIDMGTVQPSSQTITASNISMTLPQLGKAEDATDGNNNACKRYYRYVITYTYPVSNITDQTSTANNTVKVSSENGGVKVESSASHTVTINSSHTMSKSGWYDSSNNEINWTITVNTNNVDIAGAVLSDEMLAKAKAGSLTLSPSSGYKLVETKDEDGNVTSRTIKFTAGDDGTNKNQYTITYRTVVENPTWDDQTVTNNAHLTTTGGGSIDATGKVTITGGSVTKTTGTATTSEDGTTLTIPWTVTMKVPAAGIPKGTVVVDDPTKDQWGNAGGVQYMTRDQVLAWAEGLIWTNDNGDTIETVDLVSKYHIDTTDQALRVTFQATDGNTYEFQEIYANADDKFADLEYTVCTITLNGLLAAPEGATQLSFHYSTTADISRLPIGTTYFKNTATVGSKIGDATYTYNKGGLVKTDGNGNEDATSQTNKDGTLTWRLTAKAVAATDQIVVTDYLPQGITLESITGEGALQGMTNITVDAENQTISGSTSDYALSGTLAADTYEGAAVTKVTLTLTPSESRKSWGGRLDANNYIYTLGCKVDTTQITDYEEGKTYTFTNHATAETSDGSLGSASQTQKWTKDTSQEQVKVLDKSGAWDNDDRLVKYAITLNPTGKDVVEGSDVMTLTDVFKYSVYCYAAPEGSWTGTQYSVDAYLVQNSLHLYKAVKQTDGSYERGEEVTGWSWSVETQYHDDNPYWVGDEYYTSTLRITNLPDETPLILAYNYKVDTSFPSGYHTTSTLSISNSATLDGTGYQDEAAQDDANWNASTTSGEVSSDKRLIVYKVKAGDFNTLLQGAEFKVQRYDVNEDLTSGTWTDTATTLTSESNGTIKIEQSDTYAYNVIYRLVENKAPSGYQTPSTSDAIANAVYFYFSSAEDTTHTLPAKIPDGASDITKTSHQAYIENTPGEDDTTEITVEKKWLHSDGTEWTGKTGSVEVTLYRKENTTAPAAEDADDTVASIEDAVQNDIYMTNGASGPYTFTVTCPDGCGTVELAKDIPSGAYILVAMWQAGYQGYTAALEGTGMTITSTGTYTTSWETIYKIGPIMSDVVIYSNVYHNSGTYQGIEGGDTPDPDPDPSPDPDPDPDPSPDPDPDPKDEWTAVNKYTITSDNNWSLTIDNLPKKGQDAAGNTVYYTYRVEETAVTGYTTTYSENNKDGIATGTLTVTNQAQTDSGYELPRTGGPGTLPYTAAGTATILSAILYLRRRRNLSDNNS